MYNEWYMNNIINTNIHVYITLTRYMMIKIWLYAHFFFFKKFDLVTKIEGVEIILIISITMHSNLIDLWYILSRSNIEKN